jgi:predicted DNA-binding transcriptional regulator AlpA
MKARNHQRDEAPSPVFMPKGLNRIAAAAHIGVSISFFDQMVADGRMPQPKMAGSRLVWDRLKLEAYFDALPEKGDEAPGDSFADWQ